MQKHSSNISQPAADEYETPNKTGESEEPQYEDIELGHTQQGPDADHYDSLTAETQGEHQYVAISQHQNDKEAPDYIDVI